MRRWGCGTRTGPRPSARSRCVARVNDNGARAKSVRPRTIPISAGLVRLYADYLHGEYGDLDSDYVFVNLWAGQYGRPLTYAAVYDLVGRLRRRTGIDFDPHWCRHTYATGLLRAGTPVEVVSRLLGHASVTTTVEVYGHLSVEDARQSAGAGGLVRRRPAARCSCEGTGPAGGPAATGAARAAAGRGPARVPGRGARVRRGGPGVRRRSLPGRRAARGPPAARACARAITCAGSTRAARTWTCSPRRPILGGTGSARTRGCRVTGCGYGTARGGMCQLHGQRWDRAGRPDLHGWLADPPTIKTPPPGAVCAVEHCDLWPQAALPLCHAHANTWKVNGRPAIDVFVRRFDEVTVTAEEIIRLGLLGPQLRLEIQYVLQCRHDQRATKTLPAVVMAVVRALAATGAVSLLDRTEDDWRTGIGRPAPRDSNLRALLIDARRKVSDLADGDGWEGEFDRDVWQLRRLGFTGNQRARLHRDRAAVAARPGEAVAALAARGRTRAGGRPPRAARP